MKYKLLIIFAAFACIFSCKKEDVVDKPQEVTVSISESVFNCAYTAGEEKTVAVTSNGAWTVDGLTEGVNYWLSVTPLSGNGNGTVTIKCIEQNPRDYKRAAVLTFKTADNVARLVVRQLTDPERTITSTEDALAFGVTPGEELKTELYTNKAWTAEGFTEDVKKWLKLDKMSGVGNDTVTFTTLEVNEEPVTRYATIGFRINRVSCAQVLVSQPSGIELDLDSTALNFGYAASLEKKMKVFSNAQTKDWFIEGYTAEVQDWLDIDKTSGRGDAELTFSTKKANDDAVRTADLVVKVDSVHFKTLTVTQASSLEIHATPTLLEFDDSLAESKNLAVTTTTTKYAWYVEGYTEEVKKWLQLSDTTYTGLTKTINVSTLGENRTAKDRVVTLKFCISESIFTEVTVKQPMIPLKTKKIIWAPTKTDCMLYAPKDSTYGFPYANSGSSASITAILNGIGGSVLFSGKTFPVDYERPYVLRASTDTIGTLFRAGSVKGSFFFLACSYVNIRLSKAYFETPAIDGFRLSQIDIVPKNASANSSMVLVSSDKGGKTAIKGGAAQKIGLDGNIPKFILTETEEAVSYYMYFTGDRQMGGFTWTYTEVR